MAKKNHCINKKICSFTHYQDLKTSLSIVQIPIELLDDRLLENVVWAKLGISVRTFFARGGNGVVYTSAFFPNCVIKVRSELPHKQFTPFVFQEILSRQFCFAPHIHKIFMHRTRLFIVMDKVEGKTLRVWLRTHKSGIKDRLDMFLSILKKVYFMNQFGIVHKDLNAINIMVEDKTCLLKFIDFDQSVSVSSRIPSDFVFSLNEIFCELIFENKVSYDSLMESLGSNCFKSSFRNFLSFSYQSIEESDIDCITDVLSLFRSCRFLAFDLYPNIIFQTINRLLSHLK